MNKSIILCLIASISATVSFTEAKMMENCKIMLVDGRFRWVDDHGAVVTPEGQRQKLGIPAGSKLPTTQEEMDKFYEIYAKSTPEQLVYCTEFYSIAKRSALMLVFSCTMPKELDGWWENACCFLRLVKSKKDPLLEADVEDVYINLWLKTLDEIAHFDCLIIDFEKIKNSFKFD